MVSDDPAKRTMWWSNWVWIVALPTIVWLAFPAEAPRWLFMWTMAVAIYAGCKWLTWYGTRVHGVPVWRHIAYLVAWPGLDAAAFLAARPASEVRRPTVVEWSFAGIKLAFGLILLFVIARRVPAEFPYLAGWTGMVGMIMSLHFGSFHLLSCVWRRFGVDAKPLMNWPIAASGLSDFWGRRWNTAFRDLTHRFLFRPLSVKIGPRAAIGAGFVFSGVLHDLVISIPAQGGYGRPTLYFALQGLGLIVERSSLGRRMGLGRGPRGWLFAALMLLGPVSLLFHWPFVVGVMVPFLRAIRAIE